MPARRDPEATRAAILTAAEEVFLERGFGDTSTSEIARRARVTKSLLHHHFGSKEKLWDEVKLRRFKHYADVQMSMLEASPKQDNVDLLRESFEFYFRFLQRNPELVRIMAWVFLERRDGEEACSKIDDDLLKAGVARLEEAQQRGLLRDDIEAHHIVFTMLGICQHWFQDRRHLLGHVDGHVHDEVADEEYLRSVVKIFFEGVLPKKG